MEYKCKLQDLPTENRPRERLILWGAEVLSDIELVAIILGSGTSKEGVLQLSQRLLSEYDGLRNLFGTEMARLQKAPGLGPAKACIIAACNEISKRLASHQQVIKPSIRTPKDIADLFMAKMRGLKQEYLKVAYLDIKNRVLEQRTCSIGTLDSSIVHPRDIFRHAIDLPCAAVILVHNHPTGDPSPSNEDIQVTRRIVSAGEIMGIPLLDHVIIGDGSYVSLKERGVLK